MRFRKNIWKIIRVIFWLSIGIINLTLGVDKISYLYTWALLMLYIITDCFKEK